MPKKPTKEQKAAESFFDSAKDAKTTTEKAQAKEKTRKELDQKIKSNDDFTFKEAIEIGERLDQTARGLKRAKEFRAHAALATPMVVIEPEEPEVKRLTIFFQTTKKPASSASNTNSTF